MNPLNWVFRRISNYDKLFIYFFENNSLYITNLHE